MGLQLLLHGLLRKRSKLFHEDLSPEVKSKSNKLARSVWLIGDVVGAALQSSAVSA